MPTVPAALQPDATHDRLLAVLTVRHAPADEVESHWVEELAFAMWRQRRLRALEAAALADVGSGTNEPEAPGPRPPSLATLARCRARVERDLRLAGERLAAAQAERPRLPTRLANAAQARWLAVRMGEGVVANDDGERTNEPEPAAGTNEPEAPPAPARPLNRRERRRCAALERRRGAAVAAA